MIPEHPEHDGIDLKALIPFVLITFLITWSIAGFFIFFGDLAVRLLGQLSGTHSLFSWPSGHLPSLPSWLYFIAGARLA